MWISKEKLHELYGKAAGHGYRLGFQVGQVEATNRLWTLICAMNGDTELLRRLRDRLMETRPKTFVEKQVEAILWKAEEEGRL